MIRTRSISSEPDGCGDEALAIAVYCALRHENDFDAAIRAAVNHGGDSDSTGSITGNIMGTYLGYKSIPRSISEIWNFTMLSSKSLPNWRKECPSNVDLLEWPLLMTEIRCLKAPAFSNRVFNFGLPISSRYDLLPIKRVSDRNVGIEITLVLK